MELFLWYLFFPVLVAFFDWATLHDSVHFGVSDFRVFGVGATVDEVGHADGSQVEGEENRESGWVWDLNGKL